MYITNLRLLNYRNIEDAKIEFKKGTNIIYGDNAQGKTNILEAIYLFSYGKSFRTRRDSDLVNFNSDYFFVELEFVKNNRKQKISIAYDESKKKKIIKINGVYQKKLSDLIGKINIVLFKPDDISLIKGAPSIRRNFLDVLISSIKPMYLEYLNRYNRMLEERNSILKTIHFKNNKKMDITEDKKILIDVYSESLIDLNYKICEYRKRFVNLLNEYIYEIHKKVSENNESHEKVNLKYSSNVLDKEKFKKLFEKNIEKDIKKGYTEYGIHRDDIIISINSLDISKYGSQGQQKSVALSLKLAELKVIREEVDDMPILLLDDFISELDNNRVNNIISNFYDIQIIITTTDLLKISEENGKLYKIENGKII